MSNNVKNNSTASAVDQLGIDPDKMDEARLLEHPSYIELQNKLSEAEKASSQNWDRVLRIQAEMDNMQRRVERDVSNAHKFALEKFAAELLPVVDNLERALEHASDNEGVSLTLKTLVGVLEKFGVEQVNPISEPFNPEFHQAVSAQVDTSVKAGTVLFVMQKGYLLNGRLVRPALVMVSKAEA